MSSEARSAHAARVLREAASAHERLAADGVDAIVAAAGAIAGAARAGRTVLAFGNGGSAADAQHFAAELLGRYERHRRGYAAVSLATDTSVLTAVGNDFGFDRVFARQLEALGRPGDVAVGISTSGQSPNVLRALEAARSRGLVTIALTGRGGDAGRIADIHVRVDEARTPRVQEVHRTVLHILCELVETALGD